MSATPAETGSRARDAVVAIAWRQWAALGAPVSTQDAAPRAIVDPEALVLLSCALRNDERRLDDVLAWWAAAGTGLTSVQRITALRKQFPVAVLPGLGAFAKAAVDAGDARWRSLAALAADDALLTRGKRGGDVRLISPPSLMLRLRSAFGVGVKGDLIAVLLGLGGAPATVRALVAATGYTLAAVRRAADETTAARILHRTLGRPVAYAADPRDWATLLGFNPGIEPPAWRYFAQVFAFLAAVLAWADEVSAQTNPYLAASAARDLLDAHRGAFELNRIRVPEPSDYRGEAYLDGFSAAVDALARWLADAA